MKLGRKILLITISVSFISLLVSSVVLINNFKKNYTEALITGTYGLGHSLQSVVTELLSLGLPLDSFTGIDRKCTQLLQNNPYISYVGISDSHGKVLYHSDPDLIGKVFTHGVMQKKLTASKPITQLYHRFDGLDYYDVTVPILDSDNTHLGQVSLGFRTSVINDKVMTALLHVILNFSLSFVCIAILTNYFISRFVSRPVIGISEHAKKIADGDYDTTLEVSGNDEVGTLATSINQMSLQVKQKTCDLEELNAELQIKLIEREEAEASLQASEAKFRTIFDSVNDAIFLHEIGSGAIVDVNQRMCEMYGMTRAEALEATVREISSDVSPYRPEDAARWLKLAAEGRPQLFEWHARRKDGELFWVEISMRLSTIGTVDRILVTVRDITDRKRAEDERLNLEKQLLHAQKLESLGVLAGGIAHDFNNILTSIIGNADLALMRINPESPAIDNLHNIEKASARAADLAKQMLAYSGKGKFVVSNHDINDLLEEMLHILQVSISKKAVLRLNLTRPLPPVEADATQLRQIIMNLVINASEAIGDKSGVIAISTGCMDCDKSYLKDVWLNENIADGLYVFVEIADSGCGMTKETLGKLFDPFFTTKFTGRGLGMAAVLGIVRGHKGAVKVYSEPGKGSTFKILLPASGKPAELFCQDSGNDAWKGSGTVLLVDDEETVRGIGAEMLKELGFKVVTADDGREAMIVYTARPDISFVILDLTMPHMDGEQCFRELRMLNPDVKVIMSSGFSELEVTQKFVGKGLGGFIQKPYKLSVLRKGIMALFPEDASTDPATQDADTRTSESGAVGQLTTPAAD